jgi:TonB family protein
MSEIIVYLLQSSAILAVLYTVYWLFLRKDTYFQVNRFYLLSALMLSILVPLFKIRLMTGGAVSPVIILLDPVLITPEKVEKITANHLSWLEMSGVIYITGVFIFTLRLLVQLTQLLILVRRNKITHQDGANLVFVDKGYSPFSFFNLIFIRKEYYIDGKLTPVVAHEKIHIQQYHTVDLLLIEIAIIIQWFNPFAWFLGKSVKHVHEFLADEGVLKKGFRKSDYQTLILNEAMGLQINNLTNNFNVSLLKQRITMMTKARSASWSLIKVGFALPAFFAVLFLFTAGSINNLSAQDTEQKQKAQQAEEQKAVQASQTSEEPVYEVVKTMPEYPGGIDGLTQYLVTNIKYPPEAKTKGVQGRVFVSYIVEKDGSVTHVKVIRGIGSGCDEEAVRVISGMPKWSPGLNEKNQAVRVQFNLPIMFSLEDKTKKAETEEKK